MKNVYILFHDGPCGSVILGVFSTKKKAEKVKKEWDKNHTCSWDHAVLNKYKVDKKPDIKPLGTDEDE